VSNQPEISSDPSGLDQWHHLFSQDVFRKFQLESLIDIHDRRFGIMMDDVEHKALHKRGWDQAWVDWLHARQGQTITQQDLLRRLEEMKRDFNVPAGGAPTYANYQAYLERIPPGAREDWMNAAISQASDDRRLFNSSITEATVHQLSIDTLNNGGSLGRFAFHPEHPNHPRHLRHAEYMRDRGTAAGRRILDETWLRAVNKVTSERLNRRLARYFLRVGRVGLGLVRAGLRVLPFVLAGFAIAQLPGNVEARGPAEGVAKTVFDNTFLTDVNWLIRMSTGDDLAERWFGPDSFVLIRCIRGTKETVVRVPRPDPFDD
jgi:hypothetical protein